MTRQRDYRHEYQLVKRNKKRLVSDLDRARVDALQDLLRSNGKTYSQWLKEKIDNDLKEI